MLGEAIDNLLGIFSPRIGAERVAYRLGLKRLKAESTGHRGLDALRNRKGGYEAGKDDRLKGHACGSAHENDVPFEQIENLRRRAWNLYRNCPQARKITRTLGAKVIGRDGLSPHPQATKSDGTPFVEFRQRARTVWGEFVKESDWRGKPGSGGQNFATQSKTGFRSTMLLGGVLFRYHHLTEDEQKKLGLFIPLQVQLLHIDRLDRNKHGGKFFRGWELSSDGRVVGAWILVGGVSGESQLTAESTFVPISELRHFYFEEDIDQLIGSSWFGAALLTMDDRRNYEYSELIAAEMASHIVLGYRRSSGQAGYGLKGGGGADASGDRDLVDAYGNPLTRTAPGMILDLGKHGELDLMNPSRPNANAGEFLGHLLRGEAVSMPGIKGSTLTGDYRNSSFSSERSADNDVWPEIEELQDLFSAGFCQPTYEEVIIAGVIAGHFDDVVGFKVEDFNARRREYLKAQWQGPVLRSINPRDDAEAALQRVRNLQSTPQLEATKEGRDWRENVLAVKEFIAYCVEQDIPESIWQQALGIEQLDANADSATPAEPRETEQQQDEKMAARNRLIASGFVAMNKA